MQTHRSERDEKRDVWRRAKGRIDLKGTGVLSTTKGFSCDTACVVSSASEPRVGDREGIPSG